MYKGRNAQRECNKGKHSKNTVSQPFLPVTLFDEVITGRPSGFVVYCIKTTSLVWFMVRELCYNCKYKLLSQCFLFIFTDVLDKKVDEQPPQKDKSFKIRLCLFVTYKHCPSGCEPLVYTVLMMLKSKYISKKSVSALHFNPRIGGGVGSIELSVF